MSESGDPPADAAFARLRVHLRLLDDGIAPVVKRWSQHIQCAPGCSDCCHQTFRVSELEGAYLREGLSTVPAPVREEILEAARAWRPDARLACPVLSAEGRCRLYAHRPRICHKYGIPLWHPDRPQEVRTCPKNFRDAHDVDAGPILEPQAQWAEDWIALRRELGLSAGGERPIADHLLV